MSQQLSNVSGDVEQSNAHHLVMDIAWFGVALAATSRFLSIYAIHLGATPVQLGWISAVPALVVLISSSFSGWWRRRYPDAVSALFMPGLAFRLMFLLPAFAPFLPPDLQPWYIVLAVALPAIPQGIASVTFLALMREAVVGVRFTRLLSQRSMVLNVAVALGAVAFGLWLETAPFPLDYQVMFLLAFLFALGSLYHCLRVRVAAPQTEPAAAATGSPWKSPTFRQMALIAGFCYVAFTSIVAITPLHLVENLGAAEGFMALFGLVELGAGAAVVALIQPLSSRFGMRGMIALTMVGTALAAIIFGLATNLPLTLVGAALSGACWTAAAMVGLLAYFNDSAPSDQLTSYSIAYQQVVGLAAFIGPMIGSALASGGIPLTAVLMVGAALRLLAGVATEHHLFFPWGQPRRQERAPVKP